MTNKKPTAAPLVLWGFHPSMGNVVMRLEPYTAKASARRTKEGWTCAGYRDGDEPTGLEDMARAAKLGA